MVEASKTNRATAYRQYACEFLTWRTMTDLLFGAVDKYNWKQMKPWCQSIRDTGFGGDVVLLLYRGDIKEIVPAAEKLGIIVIQATHDNMKKPIQHEIRGRDTQCHQMRFFHLWQYLVAGVPKNYRYVVTTDVRDVIFQRNPFEWLEANLDPNRHQIVAPSEGIQYSHEPWGADNMSMGYGPVVGPHVMTHEIFNVGTIAAEAGAMRDLALLLFSMGEGRYIPNDQSSFNLLVNGCLLDVVKTNIHDPWACECGTTMDPSKLPNFLPHLLGARPKTRADGLVYTASGELYYMVHQWERVPELVKPITKRYDV